MTDPQATQPAPIDPQWQKDEWLVLWRNATPEAQWEALRILREATARRAKAVQK